MDGMTRESSIGAMEHVSLILAVSKRVRMRADRNRKAGFAEPLSLSRGLHDSGRCRCR